MQRFLERLGFSDQGTQSRCASLRGRVRGATTSGRQRGLVLILAVAVPVAVRVGRMPGLAQPVGAGRPAVSPVGVTADKTLAYWNGVNSLPAQMAPEMDAGPQRQIQALRSAARVIRQNSTLGVDPDLVNWALRMATILDQRADLTENSENPALLIEAFARGLKGDPLGVAVELNQTERAWLENSRAVTRERYQVRAALTARYGVQFP